MGLYDVVASNRRLRLRTSPIWCTPKFSFTEGKDLVYTWIVGVRHIRSGFSKVLGCLGTLEKHSHVLESSFPSVLGVTLCEFCVSWSWEDFNTQFVRSGNLINSDSVYVWMEILIFSPSGCKSFGCSTLSSAVWRSHVEAEAASVVEGVRVACYEQLPKTWVQDTWTADDLQSDNLSNLHVNVKLGTSLLFNVFTFKGW